MIVIIAKCKCYLSFSDLNWTEGKSLIGRVLYQPILRSSFRLKNVLSKVMTYCLLNWEWNKSSIVWVCAAAAQEVGSVSVTDSLLLNSFNLILNLVIYKRQASDVFERDNLSLLSEQIIIFFSVSPCGVNIWLYVA